MDWQIGKTWSCPIAICSDLQWSPMVSADLRIAPTRKSFAKVCICCLWPRLGRIQAGFACKMHVQTFEKCIPNVFAFAKCILRAKTDIEMHVEGVWKCILQTKKRSICILQAFATSIVNRLQNAFRPLFRFANAVCKRLFSNRQHWIRYLIRATDGMSIDR